MVFDWGLLTADKIHVCDITFALDKAFAGDGAMGLSWCLLRAGARVERSRAQMASSMHTHMATSAYCFRESFHIGNGFIKFQPCAERFLLSNRWHVSQTKTGHPRHANAVIMQHDSCTGRLSMLSLS